MKGTRRDTVVVQVFPTAVQKEGKPPGGSEETAVGRCCCCSCCSERSFAKMCTSSQTERNTTAKSSAAWLLSFRSGVLFVFWKLTRTVRARENTKLHEREPDCKEEGFSNHALHNTTKKNRHLSKVQVHFSSVQRLAFAHSHTYLAFASTTAAFYMFYWSLACRMTAVNTS